MKWQSIETAPRKHKERLLLLTSDFGCVEGWWDETVENFYKNEQWTKEFNKGATGDWVSDWKIHNEDDCRLFCGSTPTHWMPLPKPPSEPKP